MTQSMFRATILVLGTLLMLASSIAEAQWVFLARRAIGRVEQMSQSTPGSNATYDTAAVIIDAPADKVYATVARRIRAAQGVTVTREDGAKQTMEFTNGTQTASIQVNTLGDNLAHLMVSSANTGAQSSAMPAIVDHILTACRELNVECERAQK